VTVLAGGKGARTTIGVDCVCAQHIMLKCVCPTRGWWRREHRVPHDLPHTEYGNYEEALDVYSEMSLVASGLGIQLFTQYI
jgi:hypothetical protein